MKLCGALIVILVALCGYLAMIRWHDEPPLLIDGAMLARAGGEWCDVPAKRVPIVRSPQHRIDYRLGKPFNDRGTA